MVDAVIPVTADWATSGAALASVSGSESTIAKNVSLLFIEDIKVSKAWDDGFVCELEVQLA